MSRQLVTHSYDRAAGQVAREAGVQVRMLCGVWGWPAGDGVRRRGCLRCARSAERRDRERLARDGLASADAAQVGADLEAAVEDARGVLGIRVYFTRGLRGPDDGGRVRAHVRRYLDDGVGVIDLAAEQTAAEKLMILYVAVDRLLRFDEFTWQWFPAEGGEPPVAMVALADSAPRSGRSLPAPDGMPVEVLSDVPSWVKDRAVAYPAWPWRWNESRRQWVRTTAQGGAPVER